MLIDVHCGLIFCRWLTLGCFRFTGLEFQFVATIWGSLIVRQYLLCTFLILRVFKWFYTLHRPPNESVGLPFRAHSSYTTLVFSWSYRRARSRLKRNGIYKRKDLYFSFWIHFWLWLKELQWHFSQILKKMLCEKPPNTTYVPLTTHCHRTHKISARIKDNSNPGSLTPYMWMCASKVLRLEHPCQSIGTL